VTCRRLTNSVRNMPDKKLEGSGVPMLEGGGSQGKGPTGTLT
jgi:hypothetical protein